MSKLFSLQGKIYTAVRDANGVPGERIWLGNVSAGTLALSVEKSDKNESFSGSRGKYGSLIKSKGATLNLTLDELSLEGLAIALQANPATIALASVTGETVPVASLAVGDEIQLDKGFISSLVITKDPSTVLVEGTDYEIVSASRGVIKVLSMTNFSGTVTADYSSAASYAIALFSAVAAPERYVYFDGVNTVTDDGILLDLYRVQFDPASEVPLINEDWGGFSLSGSVLIDSTRISDPELGGFGRMQLKQTAVLA